MARSTATSRARIRRAGPSTASRLESLCSAEFAHLVRQDRKRCPERSADVVPTWNFAVVHATGKLRPVDGRKELNDLLSKLIAKFENYKDTRYDFPKMDETYKYGLMEGIIGFEMEIELLEGKFKLGQERSPADKQSLLKKLTEAKAPRSLRDFTTSSTTAKVRPDPLSPFLDRDWGDTYNK